jgi:cytochrome c peroxidase
VTPETEKCPWRVHDPERADQARIHRFTRLTNGFSKKIENHAHSVALFAMYYNFVRLHKTLRTTPAMAAGVTKRLWELDPDQNPLLCSSYARVPLIGNEAARSREGNMKTGSISVHSLFKTPRCPVAGLALVFFLGGPPQPAMADQPAWVKSLIEYVKKMRGFKDFGTGSQSPPAVIPGFSADADPSGQIATYQPGGPAFPAFNAFFQNLDTVNGNGRTCFTCHQPQTGWSVSAASVQARFDASSGADPIFRLIDGATCSNKDVSTLQARSDAYKLLRLKGLIRIALPLPANAQFTLTATNVNDPYSCMTTNSNSQIIFDPVTGTDLTTGGPMLSMYRRPLPATNLKFVPGLPSTTIPSAIMWDGREPSLENQSVDATLIHAEASPASNVPNGSQQAQIVGFQKGLFTAQVWDNAAGLLTAARATGGPVALSQQSIGSPPQGTPDFNPYLPWQSQNGARLSIARGEDLFNGTNQTRQPKALNCAGCHNDANVGNHATKPFFINLNTAGTVPNSANDLGALDISGLPVFTFSCSQPVTDPGLALMTGLCADIGKFKVPILRGLAARAPYFHNGSAKTLADLVEFYDRHFGFSLTDQEKADLVNFLNTL